MKELSGVKLNSNSCGFPKRFAVTTCTLVCPIDSPVGVTVPSGTAVTEKGDVHDGVKVLRLKVHTFKVECWCFHRVQVAHQRVASNKKSKCVNKINE